MHASIHDQLPNSKVPSPVPASMPALRPVHQTVHATRRNGLPICQRWTSSPGADSSCRPTPNWSRKIEQWSATGNPRQPGRLHGQTGRLQQTRTGRKKQQNAANNRLETDAVATKDTSAAHYLNSIDFIQRCLRNVAERCLCSSTDWTTNP